MRLKGDEKWYTPEEVCDVYTEGWHSRPVDKPQWAPFYHRNETWEWKHYD